MYQIYSKRLAVVSISISIYCYLIAKVIILPKLLDVAEVVVNSPNVNIHDRRIEIRSTNPAAALVSRAGPTGRWPARQARQGK